MESVVEVKNFGFSKTPYEMHQEYLRIFCDNGDKLCYISKHKRRVEWIKAHIDDYGDAVAVSVCDEDYCYDMCENDAWCEHY